MTPKPVASEDLATFDALKKARAAAVDHYAKAIDFSRQRSVLITQLLAAGYSQSDVAREMGVSRQAVQKMLSLHDKRRR